MSFSQHNDTPGLLVKPFLMFQCLQKLLQLHQKTLWEFLLVHVSDASRRHLVIPAMFINNIIPRFEQSPSCVVSTQLVLLEPYFSEWRISLAALLRRRQRELSQCPPLISFIHRQLVPLGTVARIRGSVVVARSYTQKT